MTRGRVVPWQALFALAVLAVGCRPEAVTIEKTLLARLPKTYVPETAVVSEDGKAWAFVERVGEGERVVSPAGTSDVHGKCIGLVFAPKSDRLLHWTSDGTGEQIRIGLVADGRSFPTDFLATGQLGFSADGARWFAAGAAPGPGDGTIGDITLFVDGAVVARERDLAMPAFGPDGRMAYLTAHEHQTTLLVEGASPRTFGPPTAPCGVAALASAPHPDLPLRHVVKYLGDGSLLVLTRDADGWGVYVDETRIASYPRSFLDRSPPECQAEPSFAPRSLRTAEAAPLAVWWERLPGETERWHVVRNGHPVDDVLCIETWRRHPPEPSADGAHVVYPCLRTDAAGVQHVLVAQDGVLHGPYDDVFGVALAKSGLHVAYGASTGTAARPWTIQVDGVVRAGPFASVWRPRVSDDGTVVAWEAAIRQGERGILGLNDRRLGSFDEVLWGPELEADDHVAWIVRRGRTLTRIRVPLSILREPRRPYRVVAG